MINNELNTCIICYEDNNSTINPLYDNLDIIKAKCGCKYYVHKNCINEWINKKQKDFLCLKCNSEASYKSEVRIIITPEIELQSIENDKECCKEFKGICYIWAVFLCIFIIIIILT